MVVRFESTVQIIDENDIVTNGPLRESDGIFYESLSGLYSEDHSSISLDGSSCLLDGDGFPPELAQADFISTMGTSFNSGDEPIDFFGSSSSSNKSYSSNKSSSSSNKSSSSSNKSYSSNKSSSSSKSMAILDASLNMETLQRSGVGDLEGSFSLSHLLGQNSARVGVPRRDSSNTTSEDASKQADHPDKVTAATQGDVMLGLPCIFRFLPQLSERAADDSIDEKCTFTNSLNSGGDASIDEKCTFTNIVNSGGDAIASPDGRVALHQKCKTLSHSKGSLFRSEKMLSQTAQDSSRRDGAF